MKVKLCNSAFCSVMPGPHEETTSCSGYDRANAIRKWWLVHPLLCVRVEILRRLGRRRRALDLIAKAMIRDGRP